MKSKVSDRAKLSFRRFLESGFISREVTQWRLNGHKQYYVEWK